MNTDRQDEDRQVIKAVLLDAGGVILHPDLDWISACLIERGQVYSRQELYFSYYRTILELDLDPSAKLQNPALTSLEMRSWFMTRLFRHAGISSTAASSLGEEVGQLAQHHFPRESAIYHWAMPGLRQQLERLRTLGFHLGVASNNDGALQDQLRTVGVIDLFEVLFDSGIEGVAKPDPELLWRAARAMRIPPTECLYIGDVDRIDGRAARAAGMFFRLLDPLAQPRASGALSLPSLGAVEQTFVSFAAANGYTGCQ
jgi:HAD superfamily hydrolase (TIGR01549 family)